jgi:subtilisin family serine protease
VKPHLVFWLRGGVEHRNVGSWLDAIADPGSAGPPFQPDVDRLLARYPRGWLVAHEHDPARADGWSAEERLFGLDRKFRLVSLSDVPLPPDLEHQLRALPVVERVETGQVASAPVPAATAMSARPSDWAGRMIGLEEAHRHTRGSAEVTVAVLDTGVDPAHREYARRLLPGFDFVDIIDGASSFLGDRLDADADPSDPGVGHGSHVTGILVARGERMPTGVAPDCRVLPVRVLGALRQDDKVIGAGLVDNINAGIKWAVDHGADVINMSLGIRHQGGGLPHTDVVRYAEQRGVLVVAAAGNDGGDTLYYPGALPGVVAVGAVDQNAEVAAYSTWGAQVDLVAPGTDIWSSWLAGGYAFATGTSQATPFVAGAAALCQSLAHERGRRLTADGLDDLLTSTADREDQRFKTPRAGRGRLNVPDALRLTLHRLGRGPRVDRTDSPGSGSRRERVPA